MGKIAKPQAFYFPREAPSGVGTGRRERTRQRRDRGREPLRLHGRGRGRPAAAQTRPADPSGNRPQGGRGGCLAQP